MTLASIETGLKELNNTDKQIALQMLAEQSTQNIDTELTVTPLNDLEMLDLAKANGNRILTVMAKIPLRHNVS